MGISVGKFFRELKHEIHIHKGVLKKGGQFKHCKRNFDKIWKIGDLFLRAVRSASPFSASYLPKLSTVFYKLSTN